MFIQRARFSQGDGHGGTQHPLATLRIRAAPGGLAQEFRRGRPVIAQANQHVEGYELAFEGIVRHIGKRLRDRFHGPGFGGHGSSISRPGLWRTALRSLK